MLPLATDTLLVMQNPKTCKLQWLPVDHLRDSLVNHNNRPIQEGFTILRQPHSRQCIQHPLSNWEETLRTEKPEEFPTNMQQITTSFALGDCLDLGPTHRQFYGLPILHDFRKCSSNFLPNIMKMIHFNMSLYGSPLITHHKPMLLMSYQQKQSMMHASPEECNWLL